MSDAKPETVAGDTADVDRRLYAQVIKLVREHPDLVRDAGAALNERFSESAIYQRELELKKQYRALGHEQRRQSTVHCTRAAWRAHRRNDLTLGITPSRKRVRGSDGRLHRVPRSMADRFELAWNEIQQRLQDRPLHLRPQSDRHEMAARVLLLTWLLIDPDADATLVGLDEFRNWLWDGDLDAWEKRHRGDGTMGWTPDGVPIPAEDLLVGRDWMRSRLLEDECLRRIWLPLVRHALEVVDNASTAPVLDESNRTITFCDGTTEALTPDQYRVVSRLIAAGGGWRTSNELREYPGSFERIDQIISGRGGSGGLSVAIRSHIESKRGSGYRWRNRS